MPRWPAWCKRPHRYNGLGTVGRSRCCIAPAISVTGVEPVSGVSAAYAPRRFHVAGHRTQQRQGAGTGNAEAWTCPKGWTAEPATAPFQTMSRQRRRGAEASALCTPGLTATKYLPHYRRGGRLRASSTAPASSTIGYPGVRPYPRFSPVGQQRHRHRRDRLSRSVRVGYVMGSGDDVPDSSARRWA